MKTEQRFPGLIFKDDELRDAKALLDEYYRRVEFVRSRTSAMQPQEMGLDTSDEFRWWVDAGITVRRFHQRAQAGFTFIEKLRKRKSRLATCQPLTMRVPNSDFLIPFPRQSR